VQAGRPPDRKTAGPQDCKTVLALWASFALRAGYPNAEVKYKLLIKNESGGIFNQNSDCKLYLTCVFYISNFVFLRDMRNSISFADSISFFLILVSIALSLWLGDFLRIKILATNWNHKVSVFVGTFTEIIIAVIGFWIGLQLVKIVFAIT
jgi:hypothetical protein